MRIREHEEVVVREVHQVQELLAIGLNPEAGMPGGVPRSGLNGDEPSQQGGARLDRLQVQL